MINFCRMMKIWVNEVEWYYDDPTHGIGFDIRNVTQDSVFYGLAQVNFAFHSKNFYPTTFAFKHFFSARSTDYWPEDIKLEWRPNKGYLMIKSFRYGLAYIFFTYN
jgi:hypothetical protein